MPERPPDRADPDDDDDELEREREESTDLGYRDTEEERAYEEAAHEDTEAD
jgi:hypothetical protein